MRPQVYPTASPRAGRNAATWLDRARKAEGRFGPDHPATLAARARYRVAAGAPPLTTGAARVATERATGNIPGCLNRTIRALPPT